MSANVSSVVGLISRGIELLENGSKDMDAARPMYDGGWKRTWGTLAVASGWVMGRVTGRLEQKPD